MTPEPNPKFEHLNAGQRAIADAIRRGDNVLVTGEAGTGKSFLLKFLKAEFPGLVCTATTGISALNISGCTIHSWSGYGTGQKSAKEIAKKLKDDKNSIWYGIVKAKRLAIDEISMMDAEMFAKLDEVMRLVRGSQTPFGGLQIILFGDFCQLPPVNKDGQAIRFAFDCAAWEHAAIHVFILTEVMRQKEREFAAILGRVRIGDTSEEVRRVLRPRINAVDPDPSTKPVELATHNAIADRINHDNLAALPGEVTMWEASDWAQNDHHKTALDKNCIAPKTLTLKVGAQVMLLKNLDVGAGLANGTVGKLVEIKEGQFKHKIPVCEFHGAKIELEKAEWKTERNGDVLSSRRQIPLRLAYAISIHKSQGTTLDKIRVHLKKCFADGQAYTAMSRARTLDGLFIANISGDSIRANKTALEFYARSGVIAPKEFALA